MRKKLHIPSAFSVASCVLILAVSHSYAQDGGRVVVPKVLQNNIEQSTSELEQIQSERGISEQRAAELAAEVEAIRKDRASITAALIQSAKTEK